MALFSPRHRDHLVNEFWNRGTLCCPHDGARLDTHFHPGTAGYLLVLACSRCGSKTQVTRFSDPRLISFRVWTSSDKEMLARTYAEGLDPECPVCHTTLDVRSTAQNVLHSFSCQRCGNACLISVPSQNHVCVAL